MFTSLVNHTLGTDFSDLGEGNEFILHHFQVKSWVAQDFEGHAPVGMHNTTGRALTLTWLLLDIQLTVNLIANAKMLVKIRKVWGEDAIRVH